MAKSDDDTPVRQWQREVDAISEEAQTLDPNDPKDQQRAAEILHRLDEIEDAIEGIGGTEQQN